MNEIKIFDNPEFGKVRTMEINGEPYFVGKDVAEILEYNNTKDAIATHVDADDRAVIQRSENTTFNKRKLRRTRQFFFIGYKGKGERLIFSAPRLNAIIYILLSDISQTAPKALIVCFAPSASVYLITVFSPYVTSKSPV